VTVPGTTVPGTTAPDTTVPGTTAQVEVSVPTDGLRDLYRRPPLADYLRQLWDRRHFIRADAHARVAGSTRGTVLGRTWLVLNPVLDGAAYFLIFGVLLQTSRGIPNFLGYLVVGVFLFRFTARCLTAGSQSLIAGRGLVRGFRFPRAALPVSAVYRETVSMVPVLAVMVLLVLGIPPLEQVTWRWLLLPAVLGLQLVFNLGLALTVARMTAQLPDVGQLVAFASRIWLYASGVFFAFDRFVDHPTLVRVLELNPLFVVLDMSRDLLLYATTPEATSWLLLAAWAGASLAGGLVFLWRRQDRYGHR
jgi:teichoic acid transport system permease protein